MKKYLKFFYVALFAVLALSVTSCKDDDEPKEGNIIGSWQEDDEWTNALEAKQYLKFTSDGVVFEVDIFPEYLGGDIEVAKGKYSVSGNTIKVYDFDPNYEYKVDGESTIVKLTEDKLVLSTMGMEQRYKRVADDIVDKYIKDYK